MARPVMGTIIRENAPCDENTVFTMVIRDIPVPGGRQLEIEGSLGENTLKIAIETLQMILEEGRE